MKKEDCIFCKIAAGEIPSTTICETDRFRAFFDISPASRGHALVIPKEHFDNVFELDEDTAGELFKLTTRLARILKDETGCEGMNLVQNNGEIAGQTVHHFHMHLVPRYGDDNVNLGWEHLEPDMEYLKELAATINGKL